MNVMSKRKKYGDQFKAEAVWAGAWIEYQEGRGVWGCRRVTARVNKQGTACLVGLVAKLIRGMGLVGIQKRAWKKTTIHGADATFYSDLVERDFAPDSWEVGQAVVSDITYLKTAAGWLGFRAESGRTPSFIETMAVNTRPKKWRNTFRNTG